MVLVNSIEDIKEYVSLVFLNDNNILKYFDPTVKVNSKKEVVENIFGKIIEERRDYRCTFWGIIRNGEKVGFIFINEDEKRLVSFGVAPEKRRVLNIFKDIKSACPKYFNCILFTINKRAIDWLIKNGMRINEQNELLTTLCL